MLPTVASPVSVLSTANGSFSSCSMWLSVASLVASSRVLLASNSTSAPTCTAAETLLLHTGSIWSSLPTAASLVRVFLVSVSSQPADWSLEDFSCCLTAASRSLGLSVSSLPHLSSIAKTSLSQIKSTSSDSLPAPTATSFVRFLSTSIASHSLEGSLEGCSDFVLAASLAASSKFLQVSASSLLPHSDVGETSLSQITSVWSALLTAPSVARVLSKSIGLHSFNCSLERCSTLVFVIPLLPSSSSLLVSGSFFPPLPDKTGPSLSQSRSIWCASLPALSSLTDKLLCTTSLFTVQGEERALLCTLQFSAASFVVCEVDSLETEQWASSLSKFDSRSKSSKSKSGQSDNCLSSLCGDLLRLRLDGLSCLLTRRNKRSDERL